MAVDYQVLFQKADTIASGSSLSPATVQFQLTSGNFGTHTDYYVVDYDIMALAEVVELSINGTTATVISRGRDDTAQQTHLQGAKIGSMWTRSHQSRGLNLLVPQIQRTVCTVQTVVANTLITIPGLAQTIVVTQPSTVVLNGIFDIALDFSPGQTVAVSLYLDGSTVANLAQAIFVAVPQGSRGTIGQNWIVPISAGTHTFNIQAIDLSGGTVHVNNAHSTLVSTTYPQSF